MAIIGANIYVDGIKRNDTPVPLTGTFNISAWFAPESNFTLQASLVYDDATESDLSDVQQFQLAAGIAEYTTEYQAVLDYATTQGFTTPTVSQNLINDAIILNHKSEGIWLDYDLFYFFKQNDAALYDFCTLNWRNPSQFMLTNLGANDVEFVAGSGFKVTGSNGQYFTTNFNPSLHAVKAQPLSSGVIFKIFDAPTTYSEVLRIFGDGGGQSNPVNIICSTSGRMTNAIYAANSQENPFNFNHSLINSHFHISDGGDSKLIGINGTQHELKPNSITGTKTNQDMLVFGSLYQGSYYPSEEGFGLEYLSFGSDLGRFQTQVYNIINNGNVPVNYFYPSPDGQLKFTTEDTSTPSLLFPQVIKSSKFPTLNTTKDFIILYSTDHEGTGSEPVPSNGAICWGEADSPDLTGFIERGQIIAGYQSETPHLELVENDLNGETVHLYYHPGAAHPDSGGKQQTRLLTRVGGDLHDDIGWTDRGKVLGLETTPFEETHTGYKQTYKQPNGSFISTHLTRNWIENTVEGIPKIGISSNSGNDYNWTRLTSEIDITSFMPEGRQLHLSPSLFFIRNGVQYVVGRNITYDFHYASSKICIARCDGSFNPVEYLGDISQFNAGNSCINSGFFIDSATPDVLNMYYIMDRTKMYHTTWDLTNLD